MSEDILIVSLYIGLVLVFFGLLYEISTVQKKMEELKERVIRLEAQRQ